MPKLSLIEKKSIIESHAYSAQKTPQIHRWIYADAIIFEKIVSKIRKKNPSYTDFIFQNKPIISLFIFIMSFPVIINVIFIWLILFLKNLYHQPRHKNNAKLLFIGFGANAESSLLRTYKEKKIIYINSIYSTYGLQKISLNFFIKRSLRNFSSSIKNIKKMPPNLDSLKHVMLFSIIKNVAKYSYWDAWFSQLKKQYIDVQEVVLIHTSYSAHAAVNNNFNVKFLAHGMIRHSIVFPDFNSYELLYKEEIMHVKRRMHNNVNTTLQKSKKFNYIDKDKAKGIIIIVAYGSIDELMLIKNFLSCINKFKLPIWLKLRNNGENISLENYRTIKDINIIDSSNDLNSVLNKLQPKFAVSTVSAGLFEARDAGCIPITLANSDDRTIIDVVFPYLESALNWSTQKDEIISTISNPKI